MRLLRALSWLPLILSPLAACQTVQPIPSKQPADLPRPAPKTIPVDELLAGTCKGCTGRCSPAALPSGKSERELKLASSAPVEEALDLTPIYVGKELLELHVGKITIRSAGGKPVADIACRCCHAPTRDDVEACEEPSCEYTTTLAIEGLSGGGKVFSFRQNALLFPGPITEEYDCRERYHWDPTRAKLSRIYSRQEKSTGDPEGGDTEEATEIAVFQIAQGKLTYSVTTTNSTQIDCYYQNPPCDDAPLLKTTAWTCALEDAGGKSKVLGRGREEETTED